ncbi:MAG TPA: hypothetical protein VLC09_02735, partial [Polyangiaceae bacterium]|nr:hypothetical protein [Polyangiaceae bacterium]
MMLDPISAWFEARGIPPLAAGAVLGVAFLLVFKMLVRPRADRGNEPLDLASRSARPARGALRKNLRISSTTATLPPEVSAEVLSLIQEG